MSTAYLIRGFKEIFERNPCLLTTHGINILDIQTFTVTFKKPKKNLTQNTKYCFNNI